VPILISYSKPEDGFESNLNVFFDSTAEDHLNIESIYTIAVVPHPVFWTQVILSRPSD
jgi:hypothetical protein